MKLYDCTTAPSPRRVRIFLAEKTASIELVQVDLRKGEQLGDAFRKINPDCTVPVLELDDGTRISEVVAICQYLERKFPEPPLMGRDPVEQATITMWNTKIEQNGIAPLADHFRNRSKGLINRALPGRENYPQIVELADRGKQRAEAFFERLDGQLHGRRFVAGDEFSIADISALVMVDFAAWSKITIGATQQNIRRWYDEVATRPSASA